MEISLENLYVISRLRGLTDSWSKTDVLDADSFSEKLKNTVGGIVVLKTAWTSEFG